MKLSLLLPGNWWSWLKNSAMAENPHHRELLQLLNEFQVEYLIVGGFAVMKKELRNVMTRDARESACEASSVIRG